MQVRQVGRTTGLQSLQYLYFKYWLHKHYLDALFSQSLHLLIVTKYVKRKSIIPLFNSNFVQKDTGYHVGKIKLHQSIY